MSKTEFSDEVEEIICSILGMGYALYERPGTNNCFCFCILKENADIQQIKLDLETAIEPHKHYIVETVRKQGVEVFCTIRLNIKKLFEERHFF